MTKEVKEVHGYIGCVDNKPFFYDDNGIQVVDFFKFKGDAKSQYEDTRNAKIVYEVTND